MTTPASARAVSHPAVVPIAPPHTPEGRRFEQEDAPHVAVARTDRFQHADLAAAFTDRREHRVGDAERGDHEADEPDAAEHDLDHVQVALHRFDEVSGALVENPTFVISARTGATRSSERATTKSAEYGESSTPNDPALAPAAAHCTCRRSRSRSARATARRPLPARRHRRCSCASSDRGRRLSSVSSEQPGRADLDLGAEDPFGIVLREPEPAQKAVGDGDLRRRGRLREPAGHQGDRHVVAWVRSTPTNSSRNCVARGRTRGRVIRRYPWSSVVSLRRCRQRRRRDHEHRVHHDRDHVADAGKRGDAAETRRRRGDEGRRGADRRESSAPRSGAAASTRMPVNGPPRLTSSSTRLRAAVPAMSSDDSSAVASATASTVSTARPRRRVTLRAAIAIASL